MNEGLFAKVCVSLFVFFIINETVDFFCFLEKHNIKMRDSYHCFEINKMQIHLIGQ